jgi:hypothetical protein
MTNKIQRLSAIFTAEKLNTNGNRKIIVEYSGIKAKYSYDDMVHAKNVGLPLLDSLILSTNQETIHFKAIGYFLTTNSFYGWEPVSISDLHTNKYCFCFKQNVDYRYMQKL